MMTINEEYIRNIEDNFASALFTMQGKREDYAQDSDPFSNFRFAALAAGVTVEQVFLVLLGVKLARLKNLLVNRQGVVNNESVVDTLEDSMCYNNIMATYEELKNSTNPSYAFAGEPEPLDEDAPPAPETEHDVTEFVEPSAADKLLAFFDRFTGKTN